MGSIVVRFNGLCLFFLDKLVNQQTGVFLSNAQLTAGLIAIDGKINCKDNTNPWCNLEKPDWHIPKVSIFEIKKNNEGKAVHKKRIVMDKPIFGDIDIASPAQGAAIKQYTNAPKEVPNTVVLKLKKLKIVNANGQNINDDDHKHGSNGYYKKIAPFKVAQLREIYPGMALLKPQPKRCAVRLNFNTGILFSLFDTKESYQKPASDSNAQIEPGIQLPNPIITSIYAGLEIKTPAQGISLKYKLGNNPPDYLGQQPVVDDINGFLFDPMKDYEVQFINTSQTSFQSVSKNHFLYYYSVFDPIPAKLFTPVSSDGTFSSIATNDNPICSPMGAP